MQLNKGYVVRCQLVIARRDSPTLFDLIEESLDQISGAIDLSNGTSVGG